MKGNFIYIVDKEPLCEERLAMSYNNHFSNSFFSQLIPHVSNEKNEKQNKKHSR